MKQQFRFLILEDLDTDAELMIDELRKLNLDFIYRRVENEKDFLKELNEFNPHLVLSDYSLPTFTGMDALKLVKTQFPSIPVIIVTGSINEETAVACMKAGADDYVLKDHLVHLAPSVKQTLERIQLRKQKLLAEEALKKSELHFRSVWEKSADGMRLTDKDGNIVSVNESFGKLVDIKPEQLIGKLFYVIYQETENNRSKLKIYKERFLHRTFDKYLERKMVFWSGKTVDLEVSNSFIELPNSEPLLLSIFRDVTERKKAQKEIHKLSVAIEQSPVSVIITDVNGTIEYVNPKFCEISGYSYDEAVGQNPRILKSNEQPQKFYKTLWETITSGKTWRGEFHNIKKNGELYWEDATIGPIFDENNNITHFIGFKEDITERKKLTEQLEQAQKLEAVGQLAGGVAHDFNNLLTIINGYSSIILDKLDTDSPLRKDITQIATAGEKAGALTQQLLAFSRKQIIQPKVLNLNQIVNHTEKMLHRLIGEDIQLTCNLDENLGYIKCDPGQLDQIIMNLAVNARDAMPQGGKLTIESSNVIIDAEYSALHLDAPPGHYVLLSISDNGMGMDAETKKRIFEPFFTTKGLGKGTGLGLATVYGIVKQNNGYIWVYTEPGKGTTFKIYLPQIFESGVTNKEEVISAELPKGTETILLVEDEENVRQLAAEILEKSGYTILQAANGADAIKVVNNFKESIHLLLTDVIMPEMGGLDLAKQLQKIYPDIKTIYVSGYTDETISRHGILEEGLPFIQKPFAKEDLCRMIREVLDTE